MSRFMSSLRKYLLLASVVIAVTALLLLGTGVRSAAADPVDKKAANAHEAYRIRDPKVDPKMSPVQRARIQRDAEVKKRQDTRKFINDVMAGKVKALGNKEGGAK